MIIKKFLHSQGISWDGSSVGLEHRLDRAGVMGSNPFHPTNNVLSFLTNQLILKQSPYEKPVDYCLHAYPTDKQL